MTRAILFVLVSLFSKIALAAGLPGIPFMQNEANDPRGLKATLQAIGAYKPETGQVYTHVIGMGMHVGGVKGGILTEEAARDRDVIIEEVVKTHGVEIPVDVFIAKAVRGEIVIPAKAVRPEVIVKLQTHATTAATPVAAASAPQTTPAPAVVVKAPAPVPTPVATPAQPSMTAEQVAKIADQFAKAEVGAANARVDGLSKAVRSLSDQVAAGKEAYTKLQGQLAQAPSAAKVAELEEQLRILGEARKRDVQALSEAEGRLDTEVAKLPDLAVSAAKSEVAAGLVGIKKEVDTKAGMAWVYGLVGAFVLLAVGVVASLLKRAPQPALVRQEPGVDQEAKMEQVAGQVFDKKIGPFDRQLKTVGGEASATSMTVQGLSDQVGDLAERVDDVEAGWQVELPADFEEKKTELSAEQPKYSPVLYLKGRGFYQVDITWLKDGWCRVDHVKDQGGNPLKIRTLGSKLKVAGRDDRLTKQVAPPGAEAPAEASDGTGFADTQPVAADPTVVRAGKRLATVSHIPNSIRRKEATAA